MPSHLLRVKDSSRLRRVRTARLFAATLAASSLWLSVGSLTNATAASQSSFAMQSGRQIISAAMTAATKEGSATSSSAATISGQSYTSVTNSSTTSGEQMLRLGQAQSVVRVVANVVYIRDDAAAIQAQFGVSAPSVANKWIKIPSTNSNFARFNSGILLASMLSELPPTGTLKTTKTATVSGTMVVGVTGKPNIHLGLASGTETLYVNATGTHVPFELIASDVLQGQRQTFVITFSNWGLNFHLTKPANSTPISTTKLPN